MALYSYEQRNDKELSFETGDLIEIEEKLASGWWIGNLQGTVGLLPSNYVKELYTSIDGKLKKSEQHHVSVFMICNSIMVPIMVTKVYFICMTSLLRFATSRTLSHR